MTMQYTIPMLGTCRDIADEMGRIEEEIETLMGRVTEADAEAGDDDVDAQAFDDVNRELNAAKLKLNASRALLAGYIGLKTLYAGG